jgi:hypothetical protein
VTREGGTQIRRHLSYANVTATVALAIAVAGGTAYAVDKITSHDIARNTIRSLNLKNHKGVRGKDVVPKSIKGRQIDESTLSAGPLVKLAGHETGTACVLQATPKNCVVTTIAVSRRSDLLVVTTGNEESRQTPAESSCRVVVDDVNEPLSVSPGEVTTDNTNAFATNGFARTFMSSPVDAGQHIAALRCKLLNGKIRIDEPTIAVIAVAAG